MKPHRIRMAHNLLLNYGLYKKMEIYRPAPASFEEMAKFHSEVARDNPKCLPPPRPQP